MRLYRRAANYFAPDWPLLLILIAIMALQTALGLLAAWPMAVLIDAVLTTTPRVGWIHHLFLAVVPSEKLGQVIGLAGIGLAIKLVGDLLGQANRMLTARINYAGLMRVRCDLYRKLQALSLSYHRSRPQADAIYRLTQDTYGLQAILGTLISTAVAAVTLAVMTVILLSRDVPLTLIALSVAPFLFTANVIFERRLRARSALCKDTDSAFTMRVQQSLATMPLVQAFGREPDELARFRHSVGACVRSWFSLHWEETFYWLTVGTLMGAAGAAVFGYGGYLVWHDQFAPGHPRSGGMTLGDLLIFTSYLGMVWDPLCKLTGAGAIMQGGVAGAQRVFEVLDRALEVTDAPDALALPARPRTIELRGVKFAYPAAEGPSSPTKQKRSVLAGVDVRIEPGQMVAFVGASGVGKSTLLNLLPRFFDPAAGAITWDGIDARRVRLADLRRHVALVLQESILLPVSIAENIAYGRPQATAAEIRTAAEMAGAAAFIDQLPDGYATLVQEGGSNLSGGQRQRISVARALLCGSPVVVLDEPTSALDPHQECAVTRQLQAMKGQRTIVLVSHRLSTVRACDRIFVMEDGRIVEQGTHTALLHQRGCYWSMAQAQLQLETRDEQAIEPPQLLAVP